MQERSIVERVEILERKVEALETLPDRVSRVESQLVQLRDEMRAEFSAVRAETRAGDDGLREAIRSSEDEARRVLRDEIRAGDEETRRALREEIRAGDEETRRYMRLLHDDVIARLGMIQEGKRPPKKKR